MKIDRAITEHLARLASLELTDEEHERLPKELEAIVGFVEQLNEVNTDGVAETSQVTGLQNVTREDVVTYDAPRNEMLDAMPEVDAAGHLRVHAVFDADRLNKKTKTRHEHDR